MVWIAIIAAILTVVTLFTAKRVVSLISLAVTIFFFFISFLTIVGAGNVGVPVVLGSVSETSIPEGIHMKNPFASVKEMTVRTETYTMTATQGEGSVEGDDAIQALSSDGLLLTVDTTIPHRMVAGMASWVYQNFGPVK